MRTERCACGGTITAPSLAVSAPYVEGHNATPEHFAWRLRNDLSRERPTADRLTIDLSGECARASAAAVRVSS